MFGNGDVDMGHHWYANGIPKVYHWYTKLVYQWYTKLVYQWYTNDNMWFSRVEWSGVEWSGVERSGVEWSGVELSGVEWSDQWYGLPNMCALVYQWYTNDIPLVYQ